MAGFPEWGRPRYRVRSRPAPLRADADRRTNELPNPVDGIEYIYVLYAPGFGSADRADYVGWTISPKASYRRHLNELDPATKQWVEGFFPKNPRIKIVARARVGEGPTLAALHAERRKAQLLDVN